MIDLRLAKLVAIVVLTGTASAAPPSKLETPAVVVHFEYNRSEAAQIRSLERKLERALKRARVGDIGESELHADGNDGYLYLYGHDVERVLSVVRPILKSDKLTASAEVKVRK